MTYDSKRIKTRSLRFLTSLYDRACGSEHEWFSAWEISKKLGLSEQEVRPLVNRLIKEGLICLRAFDGLIAISQRRRGNRKGTIIRWPLMTKSSEKRRTRKKIESQEKNTRIRIKQFGGPICLAEDD